MEREPIIDKEVLKSELKTKLTEALKADMDGVSEKIDLFVNGRPEDVNDGVLRVDGLKQKYSNYAEYEMYHLLTFSGMIREPKSFDFPGDDSIEKFIRSL